MTVSWFSFILTCAYLAQVKISINFNNSYCRVDKLEQLYGTGRGLSGVRESQEKGKLFQVKKKENYRFIAFCYSCSQLQSSRQSVTLLKQDKDFLAKQASETANKLAYAEERLIQLNDQCDRAKASREELYDKYVASRWGSLKLVFWREWFWRKVSWWQYWYRIWPFKHTNSNRRTPPVFFRIRQSR